MGKPPLHPNKPKHTEMTYSRKLREALSSDNDQQVRITLASYVETYDESLDFASKATQDDKGLVNKMVGYLVKQQQGGVLTAAYLDKLPSRKISQDEKLSIAAKEGKDNKNVAYGIFKFYSQQKDGASKATAFAEKLPKNIGSLMLLNESLRKGNLQGANDVLEDFSPDIDQKLNLAVVATSNFKKLVPTMASALLLQEEGSQFSLAYLDRLPDKKFKDDERLSVAAEITSGKKKESKEMFDSLLTTENGYSRALGYLDKLPQSQSRELKREMVSEYGVDKQERGF